MLYKIFVPIFNTILININAIQTHENCETNNNNKINQCGLIDEMLNIQNDQLVKTNAEHNKILKRNKRQTYDLISKNVDDNYSKFDRYLNLSGHELMKEIENELDNAFDKNLNVSITEALMKQAKGDLSLLKNKTYFLNTYNEFKKTYSSKLEHWYIGITLYLPMKMKEIAKVKYFQITRNTLPEREQMEKYWEYEKDLDYQFNIFAKKLRDFLQDHYIKLEKTFHQTLTKNTNSTVDLGFFKIIRREIVEKEVDYQTTPYLTM